MTKTSTVQGNGTHNRPLTPKQTVKLVKEVTKKQKPINNTPLQNSIHQENPTIKNTYEQKVSISKEKKAAIKKNIKTVKGKISGVVKVDQNIAKAQAKATKQAAKAAAKATSRAARTVTRGEMAGAIKSAPKVGLAVAILSATPDLYYAGKNGDLSKEVVRQTCAVTSAGACASMGAALGTLICPGIGTAIGAVIGGAAGYFVGKKAGTEMVGKSIQQQKEEGTYKTVTTPTFTGKAPETKKQTPTTQKTKETIQNKTKEGEKAAPAKVVTTPQTQTKEAAKDSTATANQTPVAPAVITPKTPETKDSTTTTTQTPVAPVVIAPVAPAKEEAKDSTTTVNQTPVAPAVITPKTPQAKDSTATTTQTPVAPVVITPKTPEAKDSTITQTPVAPVTITPVAPVKEEAKDSTTVKQTPVAPAVIAPQAKESETTSQINKTEKVSEKAQTPENKVADKTLHTVEKGQNIWNIVKKNFPQLKTNAEIAKATNEVIRKNNLNTEKHRFGNLIHPKDELDLNIEL